MVGYFSDELEEQDGRNKNSNSNGEEEEWVKPLLKSRFFGTCSNHEELKKNDMNNFCIDCKKAVCHHCTSLSLHSFHRLLQIRRYVYLDVVRLVDMQKYFDCSKVQPYRLNSAKVVFLNTRPQMKPMKTISGPPCQCCQRALSEPNQYCSIACKWQMYLMSDPSSNQSSPTSVSFQIRELNPISYCSEYCKEDQNKNENHNWNLNLNRNQDDDDDEDKQVDDRVLQNNGGDEYVEMVLKPRKRLNKRKQRCPRRAPFF